MAITINVNLDEILAALKNDLDFTGNADKYIKVNATADGFEFAAVSGGGTWGSITGTLSDQTDLQTALDAKITANSPITGATKTKVTYDANGLITSGADATTADIADSLDKRYITDAQQTILGNTSGTNTGDETTATIKTKLGAASSLQDGYLTSTDWTTFNSKQAALGFTPEDVANKSTSTSLGTSNTLYPSQNAVKSYVDTGLATKQDTLVNQTNIKSINGTSLLGSGDLSIGGVTTLEGLSGALDLVAGTNITITDNGTNAITISSTATGVTDGDKGDITVTASGATWTIDNNAVTTAKIADANVTLAKIENISTSHFIGRHTAGSGAPEQVSATQARTILNVENGAEVNNISDVNATDLTDGGDSTLHYHSADRDRANHTGSQLLSTISDVTATAAEVNILDGATLTTAELNYVDGVTSAIQTQIDGKLAAAVSINTQTASYTLVLADANKLVRMNVASANNLTIPPNSSVAFGVGTILYVEQMGAGTTTVVAGSGVTINTTALKTPYQYGTITLIQVSADVWNVLGGTV